MKKKISLKERKKQFEASAKKRFEEACEEYEDINLLYQSYNQIKEQKTWSKKFLNGYLSCISDLIYAKKTL